MFWYWRYKFGDEFTEKINCPEDDDYFDVFVAEEMLDIQDVMKDDIIPFKFTTK